MVCFPLPSESCFFCHVTTLEAGFLTSAYVRIQYINKKNMYHIPPVLSTCPLHTNSGCGKEGRILIGPW